MKILPTTFSSDRLCIEPISIAYLPDFHEYSLKPELYKYLEFDPFTTLEQSKKYLQKLLARSNSSLCQYWFIRLPEEDKVVGSIGLHSLNVNRKSVEIGYGISPDYWGRGIFTSAANILIDHCFLSLRLRRISAVTHSENLGSIKGLSKLGFNQEGRLCDYYCDTSGNWSDAILLALLNKRL